jgi:DNA-binding CsgD family transcriptional regulator
LGISRSPHWDGLTGLGRNGYLPVVMVESDPKDAGDLTGADLTEVDGPTSDLESDAGPRVSRMRVGDEDILVLSVPLPRLRYPEGTTSAEHAIIDAVLQGLTVKEIAEQRGASLRTVTTQLGTIFRKAEVNSQAELIAIMSDDADDA